MQKLDHSLFEAARLETGGSQRCWYFPWIENVNVECWFNLIFVSFASLCLQKTINFNCIYLETNFLELVHLHLSSCLLPADYSCINLYIQACMHSFMHSCMHSCIQAFMHLCIYAFMHSCMYAFMHSCINACMHLYICAFMHSCMHSCIHACMYAGLYRDWSDLKSRAFFVKLSKRSNGYN